ncbi:MAG: dipeptide epimerase [Acidimicrobiales bacterium]
MCSIRSSDRPIINSISCRRESRLLRATFRTSLREVNELDVIAVDVTWSDGMITTGEVSPTPPITGETAESIVAAVTGPLAHAIVGLPLAEHDEILVRIAGALFANTTAKCALDLAVHRALAERNGGLAAVLGVPVRPVRTDVTISLASPEAMAAAAAQRSAEGFDILKLKVGDDVDRDVARVLAVSEVVDPSLRLRLDANQGWSAKQALQVLARLERADVTIDLLEQPVPASDLRGMATVTRHSAVSVLADESVHSARDVLRVAELGAADMVNVKLAKCGGVRAAREVIAVARACGLGVLIGCMLEPASAVAAAATLAMGIDPLRGHDLDAGWWVQSEDEVICTPPLVTVVSPEALRRSGPS